jgi:hypothetical protein
MQEVAELFANVLVDDGKVGFQLVLTMLIVAQQCFFFFFCR